MKVIIFCTVILSTYSTYAMLQPPFTTIIPSSITQLSLDEKIGQLFMVAAIADREKNKQLIADKSYRTDQAYIEELVTHHHIGGIIFLGKSDTATLEKAIHHYQSISKHPLLIRMTPV